MQEALLNKRVHVEPYHAGLWWRELLRGGVTLLFALLLLFTFNVFITVLGICKSRLSSRQDCGLKYDIKFC